MNKTKIRKCIWICVLFAMCLICFILPNVNAKAQNATSYFSMVEGASVRIPTSGKDDAGIKFSAEISQSKLDEIKKENAVVSEPIYFGIEISSASGKTKEYCNVVDDLRKIQNPDKYSQVNFNNGVFTYDVSILYNQEQLKIDLATSSKFNTAYNNYTSDQERIDNFDEMILENYMKEIYNTELTAKAFYRINNGAKVYVDNPQTRSMWGVATAAFNSGEQKYFDGSGQFILSDKYFTSTPETALDNGIYLQKDGEIVGDISSINATDKLYLNGQQIYIDNSTGKNIIENVSVLSDLNLRETVKLSAIDENKNLTVINTKFVTVAIDEVADFAVFNLDKEWTGTAVGTLGKVVSGYYVLTCDIDANYTNMGLDHSKLNSGATADTYNTYSSNYALKLGFIGEFDGLGHVVKNFAPSKGGIFGRLATFAHVSNIAFENAIVNDDANVIAYNANRDYLPARTGSANANSDTVKYDGMTIQERNDLAYELGNTSLELNNIYIGLSKDVKSANGVILCKNNQYNMNIYYNNIIIDASDCTLDDNYSLFLANSVSSATAFSTNVAVIYDGAFRLSTTLELHGVNSTATTGKKDASVKTYKDYTALLNDKENLTFKNGYWNVEGNNLFFKGLEDEIKAKNIVLKDVDGNIYKSSLKLETIGNFDIIDVFGNKVDTVENFASDNVDVISFEEGQIKVKQFVVGTYNLSYTVDGALKEFEITLVPEEITIISEAIYDTTNNRIYYTDNEGVKKVLDADAFDIYYVENADTQYKLNDNVTYLYADSATFSTANTYFEGLTKISPKLIAENKIIDIKYTAKTSDYTGVKVEVNAGNAYYTFTDTVFATAVIDDGAELKQIFNQADKNAPTGYTAMYGYWLGKYGTITKGVYMLADDFDAKATGFTFDNSYFNFFEGVFDGRGHTISNLDVSISKEDFLSGHAGNGLFSAISAYSQVQNVSFENVKANYGSVFQGNSTFNQINAKDTYDDKVYGLQFGMDKNNYSTATMKTYLKSLKRIIDGGYNSMSSWSDVYVKVASDTTRLMGVISRNVSQGASNGSKGSLNAFNLVIEYLPTTLYDTSIDAYDGALPFGYDYTNGQFGVLFGGAYNLAQGGNVSSMFDCPAKYAGGSNGNAAAVTACNRTYYTPSGSAASILNFYNSVYTNGNINRAAKIYVISNVELVSSKSGAIDGTNESGGTYKFAAKTNAYYPAKLERYNSYAELIAKNYTKANLDSYELGSLTYWNVTNGYLSWKGKDA